MNFGGGGEHVSDTLYGIVEYELKGREQRMPMPMPVGCRHAARTRIIPHVKTQEARPCISQSWLQVSTVVHRSGEGVLYGP